MSSQLPAPKNAIAEILRDLIIKPSIKERMFQINSFRDAISQLKNFYKVPIRYVDKKEKSKYGKTAKYRSHFLLTISRKKAIRTYLKINQA